VFAAAISLNSFQLPLLPSAAYVKKSWRLLQGMRSINTHEAITHLAMPERQIPVLIDSSPEKTEGFVPSIAWNDKPVTRVRRLLPSFVQGLASPQRRREIEKEHGTISATEWNRLRELLSLIDRMNAGDWSPITSLNAEKALEHLPSLLDRLSPGGWLKEVDESGTGKQTFRSVSGSKSIEIVMGEPTFTTLVNGPSGRKAAPRVHPVSERDGRTAEWSVEISARCKTAAFALSEAFTAGLRKTRFVVWWSDVGKRLVPGLYCPDIVTALYALAMWSSGTAGGWAICQKCNKDYPRSRAKQLYCSHRCQVAAAMKRYRKNLEIAAKSKSKTTAKNKKRTGRK
jgi:hypothetical protein